MATLSRKERERLQREQRILALALQMLREGGYLGLNMDRIAAEMEYSKGTIYQHFRNKEEILLALANEALEKRLEMFLHASQWDARSRYRMAAIGAAAERFVEQFPHHFAVEQILRSTSIWEKTSAERRAFMRTCESRCMQVLSAVVRDALARGDLELPGSRSPEDLVFGLWSMNWGAYTILASSDSLGEIGIADPVAAVRFNMNLMLDGYGWRPLSTEVDFGAVIGQAKQELFGDE